MRKLLIQLKKSLHRLANLQRAKDLAWFFKTGKGEYGEGDKFLGISVPQLRKIALKFNTLDLVDIQKLLNSKFHEERLLALLILIERYKRADMKEKKKFFDFYLKNTKNINNWDLIDLSAPKIVGDYLSNKDRLILYKLAKSKSLWERRMAVLSTFWFIRNHQFADALKIAEMLLKDKHDLIHKAVGWMLREIGKRNQKVEEEFLQKHYKRMPRTMLRYAIEKFRKKEREYYLQ